MLWNKSSNPIAFNHRPTKKYYWYSITAIIRVGHSGWCHLERVLIHWFVCLVHLSVDSYCAVQINCLECASFPSYRSLRNESTDFISSRIPLCGTSNSYGRKYRPVSGECLSPDSGTQTYQLNMMVNIDRMMYELNNVM